MITRRYAYLLITTIIALVFFISLLQTFSSVTAAHHASSIEDSMPSSVPADRWRILADMRKGRGDPGVATFEDKLYVIGGYFSNGFGYPESLEVYDPISDTWQIQGGIPVTRAVSTRSKRAPSWWV